MRISKSRIKLMALLSVLMSLFGIIGLGHIQSISNGQMILVGQNETDSEDSATSFHGSNESFQLGVALGLGMLQVESDAVQHRMPVVVKPEAVKKIFIVTTWRSGSTFVSELIHSSPGVFYSFEPAHYIQFHRPTPNMTPMELIRSVFNCSFSTDYLRHVSRRQNGGQDFLIMNRRIWQSCQHDQFLCVDPNFMHELCTHFPVQLVKEVRLTLDQVAKDGLTDSPGDWKVVYLVRDPRASLASRSTLTWCRTDPKCWSVQHLCNSIENDLSIFDTLKKKHPDRYYLLKYEDLAVNVETETEKLFRFLDLPVSPSVRVFLDTHTKATLSAKDPHSTHRLSKFTPSAWRDKLPSSSISSISTSCSSVLKSLNYSV